MRDTSANKAIKGFAAAGGWINLKYIINVTVVPTANPRDINEIPINSLNNIPIIIPSKCPKKIFFGWANSLSWNNKTIKVVDPKENINQKPVDVSKLKKDNKPIIIDAAAPAIKGSNFFDIFIYFFKNSVIYT